MCMLYMNPSRGPTKDFFYVPVSRCKARTFSHLSIRDKEEQTKSGVSMYSVNTYPLYVAFQSWKIKTFL